MQTSGLVLDMQDDVDGSVLRSIYSSLDDVPGQVKTAHTLTGEDRDSLPDHVFALVLEDQDARLRKFACVDEGNTMLSVQYFLKTAHRLPAAAQKLAAQNLCTACSWYGLQPPELLQKVAMGPLLARGAALVPRALGALSTAQNVVGGAKAGVEAVRGGMGSAGSMIKGLSASEKTAGSLGAFIKRASVQRYGADERGPSAMGRTVPRHERDSHYPSTNVSVEKMPDSPMQEHPWDTEGTTGAPSGRQNHRAVMVPLIDVRGLDAPKEPLTRKVSHYALGTRYAIDNPVQIKQASAYFDVHEHFFAPEDRREYCRNLVKRASALGIPVSDAVRKYGADGYATAEEMKVAMDIRKSLLTDHHHVEMLSNLFEKRASLSPELYCETLRQFDYSTDLHRHYDRHIPDPYWSTYGEKTASFLEVIGNETVTEDQLRRLASIGNGAKCLLARVFDDEFVREFRKDPVAIFKSMPRDQKLVIMRMAVDNHPAGLSA